MVISHCNQLRVLNLLDLWSITGMCALCEDPEPTLCFITLWYMILIQQVLHGFQSPTQNHIVSQYNLVHIVTTFSLILNSMNAVVKYTSSSSSSISLSISAVTCCVSLSEYSIFYSFPAFISHEELISKCFYNDFHLLFSTSSHFVFS